MKNLFALLLLLLVCTGVTMAQSVNPGKISGTVTDSLTTKPVPYVLAALKSGDKLISGTAADEAGTFLFSNLPLGSYSLEVSYLGYRSQVVPVTLTEAQPTLQLKSIKLSADNKVLSTVEVTGMKAIVENKGDRLVYNAEQDASNAGGTAADVLRKVPTLTVDLNGNVQVRGNSNLKVLINGKASGMMARNLADALKQLPANSIKSVEVITSPGAKYDAEGSAGVINIITKKGLQGFNGSTNVTVGDLNRVLGGNLNYKKGKFGISFSGNGYQYRNKIEGRMVRTSLLDGQPVTVLTQNEKADNTGTGGYGELNIDFDPDSTSRINFAASGWGGRFPNNTSQIATLKYLITGQEVANHSESRFRNPYGNGQFDLGYTKTFKPEQEFSLLSQYSLTPDNYFSETDTYSGADELSYRQRSTNYSRNKELTLQSDYTHPFELKGSRDTTTLKLEVGAKAIRRDIGSEFRVEESRDGKSPLVQDPSQTNEFNYEQWVYSGYTSLRLNTKSQWSATAGLRYEHTEIEGDFKSTKTDLASSYTNFIPSLSISKTIKSHTLSASYTQRIQRPLIWYLNPWVNSRDTLNLSTGNPDLKPELSHAVEVSHSVYTEKGLSVNSALYWRYTDNSIQYLSKVQENGVLLSRPENIAERRTYGLNLNLSGQPFKNWNLSGGGDLNYTELKSPTQQNSDFIWNANLNSTYQLPKDYSLQVNGGYYSGWLNLQGNSSGFYWYGFAAKRTFWDKKGSLSLGVNNPFAASIKQTGKSEAPTFTSEYFNYNKNRSVRLTFEWRFGQMSQSSGRQSKKIKNDDAAGGK